MEKMYIEMNDKATDLLIEFSGCIDNLLVLLKTEEE